MDNTGLYTPPLWLRSGGLQTALASSKLRLASGRGFDEASEKCLLDVMEDLQTSCYINMPPRPKGLVVLVHGWLGTPHAGYVVAAAKTLFDKGYATARVTLPDHGDAVLLNARVVPVTRTAFLRDALLGISAAHPDLPMGLVGFSLGGNFVLRIARDLNKAPVQLLRQVIAVSPVIDPETAGLAIDRAPLIRRYFMRKFARLYRQKLARYPQLAHMSDMLSDTTSMGLTETYVTHLPEYADIDGYFDAYRIWKDDLVHAPVPVTLLSAQDDPIVPPASARTLADGPNLERIFTRYGGHNAFFERFPKRTFSDRIALERFAQRLVA
jgi:predicted alpha/beta-fold hydrolase